MKIKEKLEMIQEDLEYMDIDYSYDMVEEFPELTIDRFMQMYKKCKNSKQKIYAKIDLANIYNSLSHQFATRTYEPLPFTKFTSLYPSPREIYAPSFSDRIVHHHLVDYMLPSVEKYLYHHSYANRINKGTHKGVFSSQSMMRSVGEKGYYMQCDISSYFTSINKHILSKILKFHIGNLNISDNDKDFIYYLFTKIIFQNPEKNHIKTGKIALEKYIPEHKKLGSKGLDTGLPIGAYSSQFESMIFMNEADYFCKHELKIKNYIRYVDDLVIFEKDSRLFSYYYAAINSFLKEKLKLELNPVKTKIQPFHKGLDFLGYVIYPHHINIRKRNIVNFKNKLKYANLWLTKKYSKARQIILPDTTDKWKISPSNYNEFLVFKFYFLQILNSYFGNYIIANTYNLRRDLYLNHFGVLKELYSPINSFNKFIIKP